MDKLLQLLGADKLNESTQAEIKTKLQDVIDIKAKEISESKLDEEKEALVEKYEQKFEEYKKDVTTKFSNFVDNILEEELAIPEKILEFAKKGELYDDLIEQFKVRLGVDQGLLDEEVKSLLKEAKEEILKLRKEMNSITEKNLEVVSDAQKMAAQLYLYEKCEGLTEKQKGHVMAVLEGVQDKAEIDRKFSIIVEQYEEKDDEKDTKKDKKDKKAEDGKEVDEEDDEDEDDEDEDDEKKEVDEEDEKEDDEDKEEVDEEDEEDDEKKDKKEVDEEDEEDEEDKKKEDKKEKMSEGHSEIKKRKKKKMIKEDTSPFASFKKQYLNILRTNKI